MSILREYSRDSHNLVESTKFMRAIFEKKLPLNLWYDFVYQKSLFYKIIEDTASASKYSNDFIEINRSFLLYLECKHLYSDLKYRDDAIEFFKYLKSINVGDRRILAHLYTWHMGDMYGGQMIKRVLSLDSPSLDFKNRPKIIEKLENLLDIDLVNETNIAFDWAYKILKSYDVDLSR